MKTWNVTFIGEYATLTTTVTHDTDPVRDDAEKVVDTARAFIMDEYGFDPLEIGFGEAYFAEQA